MCVSVGEREGGGGGGKGERECAHCYFTHLQDLTFSKGEQPCWSGEQGQAMDKGRRADRWCHRVGRREKRGDSH